MTKKNRIKYLSVCIKKIHTFITDIISEIDSNDTEQMFDKVLAQCRDIFEKKLHDYRASWRVMRTSSLVDQLYIKAKRIQTLQDKKAMIYEGARSEYIAIINYCIIGLIQIERGYTDYVDITNEEALQRYDHYARKIRRIMIRKNYNQINTWRNMSMNSYIDFILTRILRMKEIEHRNKKKYINEYSSSNYIDITIYSVFAIMIFDKSNTINHDISV